MKRRHYLKHLAIHENNTGKILTFFFFNFFIYRILFIRSNWDNFDRLKQYHIRYKKLHLSVPDTPSKTELTVAAQTVSDLLFTMEESLRSNASKNVKILHLAEDITRSVQGIRLTSCKSAKDRTAMAVTLEQCRILQKEFHLPATNMQVVLDTMRG